MRTTAGLRPADPIQRMAWKLEVADGNTDVFTLSLNELRAVVDYIRRQELTAETIEAAYNRGWTDAVAGKEHAK